MLVVTAFVMAFLGYRLGEKIRVSDGYGWDGVLYGSLAEDVYKWVFQTGLTEYHVQRVLPSAVVHCGLRLLGIARTRANIICTFGLLNVALVTLAAGIWCRMADHAQISLRGKWLGFVGLFVNFALLKWTSYYAVLTDVYAFAIGLAMLYAYLTDRRVVVIGLTLVGAFVWPALIYQGVLLVMFPRAPVGDLPRGAAPWYLHRFLALAVALTVCALVACLPLKGMRYRSPNVELTCGPLSYQPMSLSVGIALACVFVYLWLGMERLFAQGGLFAPRCWLRSIRPLPLLSGLILLLGTRWLIARLARFPTIISTEDVLPYIGWMSIRKPGLFGVAHIIYFGPILLLALARWRQVGRALSSHGFGLTLGIAANLLLSLDCESRHQIHCFPIVVFGVVQAMEGVKWRAPQYVLFVLLALAFSKCWLTIGGMPDATQAEQFPAQLLFMNSGPWMSWPMYYVQGSFVVLAGCLLYVLSSQGFAQEAVAGAVPCQVGLPAGTGVTAGAERKAA
jgi:hypothetical protein